TSCSEQETRLGRRVVNDFRDVQRRKNVQQKQPAHETGRSYTTEPHIAEAQDRNVIRKTCMAVIGGILRPLLFLLHKFPEQQTHHDSWDAGDEECPSPSEAGRDLRSENGSGGESNQCSSTYNDADVSPAPTRWRRLFNNRRNHSPARTLSNTEHCAHKKQLR